MYVGNDLTFDASLPGSKGDTKELVFLGNHLAVDVWA